MKFIIIIYTTNELTVVEKEDIRGVRLRKFKLRKIVLGVRMHFRHTRTSSSHRSDSQTVAENRDFCLPHLYSTPLLVVSVRILPHRLLRKKTRMTWLPDSEKF